MTHRTTARANTASVHFWPMVQGPSAARCSAMIRSAPSMERTSAGNILFSTTAVMAKYTTMAMAPHTIHWKKEMWTSAIDPSRPMMMRLGVVPMGVSTPPTEAA